MPSLKQATIEDCDSLQELPYSLRKKPKVSNIRNDISSCTNGIAIQTAGSLQELPYSLRKKPKVSTLLHPAML
jgi:hypothetical protein